MLLPASRHAWFSDPALCTALPNGLHNSFTCFSRFHHRFFILTVSNDSSQAQVSLDFQVNQERWMSTNMGSVHLSERKSPGIMGAACSAASEHLSLPIRGVPFWLRSFAISLMLILAPSFAWAADQPRDQTRVHSVRVSVPVERIVIDDGDTILIQWEDASVEFVRILGIDTPETRHVEHDIPFDQPFGPEATAFARGVFSMAERVELLRASTLDPYDRTLGYVFVNGRNFSVLILTARLAVETVSVFGDNGFPDEAAACLAAAAEAGPVAFESPHLYRRRMREVSQQMRADGLLPAKE
jgi:micrococcal nuclease